MVPLSVYIQSKQACNIGSSIFMRVKQVLKVVVLDVTEWRITYLPEDVSLPDEKVEDGEDSGYDEDQGHHHRTYTDQNNALCRSNLGTTSPDKIHPLLLLRRYDMNRGSQTQGDKNWILPKVIIANHYHWLEIWKNH